MPLMPITPPAPVPIYSGFDYVVADAAHRRIYAAHTSSEALTIVDADSGKVVGQVRVGPMHGIAVDPATGHVFTGDGESDSVSEIDPVTMKVLRSADVDGHVDAIAYDPSNGHIYADEDDGTRVFVVDAKSMKSIGTVTVPGHKPEYLAIDPATHVVYQNIADMNEFVVIDGTTLEVTKTVKTPEITGNHPLQYDPQTKHVIVGGQNGLLSAYDAQTGKLVGTAKVQARIDQCTLEPSSQLIACAGSGELTLLHDEAAGAPTMIGRTAIAKSAHTTAIDPTTGHAFVVWAQPDGDFVQAYSTK